MVEYNTKERRKSMQITAGAAQSSILEPDLWNIIYGDLLRPGMPKETCVVGYVEDVAVLIWHTVLCSQSATEWETMIWKQNFSFETGCIVLREYN